jgi:hypothetical protein
MRKTEFKTTLTCDRCKKSVGYIGEIALHTPGYFTSDGYDKGRRETVADLCDDCWDLLMDFLGRERSWWRSLMRYWPYMKETNVE